MRRLALIGVLAIASFGIVALAPAIGHQQETVSYTGCLNSGEMEGQFYLTNAKDSEDMDVARVDLVPTEEVNMSPHVGHTVQVTGTPMESMEGSEDPRVQVTAMQHVAASCQ